MSDLAKGGVVGAAFGEVFAILHDAVKHVIGQIKMFKPELELLQSTLDGVESTVRQIEELRIALNFPEKETKSLVEQMKKGKDLVDKCSKIKRWNWKYYVKAYFYSKKLSKLNRAIERFCRVNLITQIAETGMETLSQVNQNARIGSETLTQVKENARTGVETLAVANQNKTIGSETLTQVKQNTRTELEIKAEVNKNTTIGRETLDGVKHNTMIGLETKAEVSQNTRIGKETLTAVRTMSLALESQKSDVKKKYGTLSCAVPKPRDYIVGFDLHLKELKRKLLMEEVSVLILTALGGCGKTTLVKMLGWDKEIIVLSQT